MALRGLLDLSNMDWDEGNDEPKFSLIGIPERTSLYMGMINMFYTLVLNIKELAAANDYITCMSQIMDDCILYAIAESHKVKCSLPQATKVRFVIHVPGIAYPVISEFKPFDKVSGQTIINHFAKSMNQRNKIELDEPMIMLFQFC